MPRAALTLVLASLAATALPMGHPAVASASMADPLVVEAARRLARDVVRDLPDDPRIRTVIVVDLPGDVGDLMAGSLRDEIARTARLKLLEPSFLKKLERELNLVSFQPRSLQEALEAGRKLGVDAILFGEVTELGLEDDAVAAAQLRLADVKAGGALFADSYRQVVNAGFGARTRLKVQGVNRTWRLLLWVLGMAALPFVLIKIVKELGDKESGLVNFGVLAGLTSVDLLVALTLLGFSVAGFAGWTAVVLALLVGAAYNYVVVSLIVERL